MEEKDIEKIQVTQHAIDQFVKRFLKSKYRLHRESFYSSMILIYLKDSVQIELPAYVFIKKILKYDGLDEARYFANQEQRLLFVIVNRRVVTCFHPFEGTKQLSSKKGSRPLYPKSSRRR